MALSPSCFRRPISAAASYVTSWRRYAAMNVTWQAVDAFEDYPDARALLKEIGGVLKQFDGYHHPRTTGAHITSVAVSR